MLIYEKNQKNIGTILLFKLFAIFV